MLVYDKQCNFPSDAVIITGAKDGSDSKIKIYPNPVSEKLTIEVSLENEIQCVELLDVLGNVVLSRQVLGNHIQVDVHDVPSSLYFIKVISTKGELRSRISILK